MMFLPDKQDVSPGEGGSLRSLKVDPHIDTSEQGCRPPRTKEGGARTCGPVAVTSSPRSRRGTEGRVGLPSPYIQALLVPGRGTEWLH